ncbi:hypothetical protein MNV49_000434 [Pseudohyphozyma bogoriensis]|nr:hypothetical protein MNV49_000434 [Pseudohyphozyma bogoriensis]
MLRFSSPALKACKRATFLTRPISTLHAKLTAHYIASGDSESDAASLAAQELGWLEAHARETSVNGWEEGLDGMVQEMIVEQKPLAYILGTGCISLALGHHLPPSTHVTAIDVAPSALTLAKENLARNPLPTGSTMNVVEANLFDDSAMGRLIEKRGFDLVVSNPPYITEEEYKTLPPSVKDWEDRGALVGPRDTSVVDASDDGLIFYRRIAALLPTLLDPATSSSSASREAPVVALEVGKGQAGSVVGMLEEKGLKGEVMDDPWGVGRCVLGYLR